MIELRLLGSAPFPRVCIDADVEFEVATTSIALEMHMLYFKASIMISEERQVWSKKKAFHNGSCWLKLGLG